MYTWHRGLGILANRQRDNESKGTAYWLVMNLTFGKTLHGQCNPVWDIHHRLWGKEDKKGAKHNESRSSFDWPQYTLTWTHIRATSKGEYIPLVHAVSPIWPLHTLSKAKQFTPKGLILTHMAILIGMQLQVGTSFFLRWREGRGGYRTRGTVRERRRGREGEGRELG